MQLRTVIFVKDLRGPFFHFRQPIPMLSGGSNYYSGSSSSDLSSLSSLNSLNSQGLEVESFEIREEIGEDGSKKFVIISEIRVREEEKILEDIFEEELIVEPEKEDEEKKEDDEVMAKCPQDPPNLHGRVTIDVENLETNPEKVKVRS